MTAKIARIARYPVKGLTAETLPKVELAPGKGIPHDRRFAIAHRSAAIDPVDPEWRPKSNFATLMRNEKLARLRNRFDPSSGLLTIDRDGKKVVEAHADRAIGRAVLEQFFGAFLGDEARGGAQFVEAADFAYTDSSVPGLSLVNLASVRDLERVTGVPVDPVRFRANVYFECDAPWVEFGWVGQEVAAGPVRLAIRDRIERCAATGVNPDTAERDMNLVQALQRGYGHTDMGVFAEVSLGGVLKTGDSVRPDPES